jgi:hypothetical protein
LMTFDDGHGVNIDFNSVHRFSSLFFLDALDPLIYRARRNGTARLGRAASRPLK